ncbi:hypothetical protein ECPA39_2565, partial [Escherichia coli PA39]
MILLFHRSHIDP